MILDERLEFADDAAVAVGVGTALLGDVIDLGGPARDIGVGKALMFVVQVTQTFTSAGAATVEFTLASDAQAAIAVDGTATVHYRSGAQVLANLSIGKAPVVIGTPRQGAVYERYLGVVVTVATAALTAGKVNAFLTSDYAKFQAYHNAY